MARKKDRARSYAPDFCDAETIGYRLCVATETVQDWARRGLLPKSLDVGTQQRWRWSDVEAWIAAKNGELDAGATSPLPSEDPFSRGIANAKANHASN